MSDVDSLWGEEFSLPDTKTKTKEIKNKISKPKEVKISIEKQIKSKKITLDEKLALITNEVTQVLGKQKDNILCVKDLKTFHDYISTSIRNNLIAIDTETNNSLDPITCKLMGLCLYTPGEKQIYIPVNHRNPNTQERLDWQITEAEIKEELQRLLDNKTYSVLHNGKFDYEVIKCTCNICINVDWDTMIGAKLLDENERSAGLKQQYIDKIDPTQEKYDIEHLFKDVEYADVDPEVFSYYAATDALMTYKLYMWQMNKFKDPDLSKVLNLANTVEMPLVKVIAEMELAGMEVDIPYATMVSKKYHKDLDEVDAELMKTLNDLKPQIDAWKLTKEATDKQQKKLSEKQYANAVKSSAYNPELFTKIGNDWYKVAKPKVDQLDDELTPDSLGSATQLAIILYDILKCPVVNKEKPRGTGEDELEAINKLTNLPICKLLIKRRGLVKLISTYIDTIPELSKRWPDGRVRTHFNAYGAQTGRLSSSDPINFQNIPSHCKLIRPMFKAHNECLNIIPENNIITIPKYAKVNTPTGMQFISELNIGDLLRLNDEKMFEDVIIKNIIMEENNYIVTY